jgi:CheY-like chemotaxis protein
MLCDDLIFSSKVSATGRAHGIDVAVARSAVSLLKKAEAKPACVILDLHAEGLDISSVVNELKKDAAPRIIGFGSHVDAALLKAAREAGCDLVMPRSQFHKLLESDLPVWVQH